MMNHLKTSFYCETSKDFKERKKERKKQLKQKN